MEWQGKFGNGAVIGMIPTIIFKVLAKIQEVQTNMEAVQGILLVG
jgi:hypothetical protein